jgi:hypothetical protein
MQPSVIVGPVAAGGSIGEQGLAEDLSLDAPCPTVGTTVVGITTADATRGSTGEVRDKEDAGILGTRWQTHRVYPGSAPPESKRLTSC